MTTLRTLGEREMIRQLTARLRTSADVKVGPGDDCAVVRAGDDDWLLTSDPVIEGIHFEQGTAPDAVGYKAVGRTLSDIAAMGGTPCWALVDVVTPAETPAVILERLYDGMAQLADHHGLTIVGGDMAAGPVLALHVFTVGRVPANKAVLRSGANPGDILYVTGALGGSRAGHHLCFAPRVREGRWLRDWATAMMDLSDGLAADLPRLAAASGTGARIRVADVPITDDARHVDGAPAVEHALGDGEDFELLFTVPAGRQGDFEQAWRTTHDLHCAPIGTMTEPGTGCTCALPDGAVVDLSGGYEHFRASGEDDHGS